jgi:hypothetical protein
MKERRMRMRKEEKGRVKKGFIKLGGRSRMNRRGGGGGQTNREEEEEEGEEEDDKKENIDIEERKRRKKAKKIYLRQEKIGSNNSEARR